MVYAKIIYLLMVVISGALCTVEDYVIMSQCAHNKAINLAAEGTVSVTDISQTQNITIVGRPDFVNNNFKIALYAKETQRYLCFNDHWKLIGMKELQDTCYFNEAIVHGYFVFRSVVDLQRRIGFTQRGRAVGPKKSVNDACYMFTKIPADQFFHQHTHFSTPKIKSTTTKKPETEYANAPYSTHVGRGSGGGRTKINRYKNQHHQDDGSITHNHSGSGSGVGGGSGNGNGNGKGNKKFRKQRNGNKQRQEQLKQTQELQLPVRGHRNNINNPKNSTYLNSSRQNLVLSQHSINNHTNRKHNNSSNNNNNNHPPQNHQVRHHHNDPNKIARRQQHDQKQKTKMRQRVRPNPSTSLFKKLTTKATLTTATTPLTEANTINSTKPHYEQTSDYTGINPTSVVSTLTTVADSDSRSTMTSTVVVTKRKGRRRKMDKIQKKSVSTHAAEEDSSLATPSVDEESYLTSSTDYASIRNDIMLASVKPTSASLPSWETWYPSSSTSNTEEDSDYFSASSESVALPTATETNTKKGLTRVPQSSSMTDFKKNTITLRTSVPLPTSQLSTTLTDNSIDESISPTATADLGMTTTNTSTFTQTDFWSSTPNDNTDANVSTLYLEKESFNTYATPKLENTQNILNTDEALLEDTSSSTTQHDSENATAVISFTTTEHNQWSSDILTSSFTDLTAGDTNIIAVLTTKMSLSKDYDQTSDAFTPTTTTLTNNCTSRRSKSMTDTKLATKATENIANPNPKRKNYETTSPPNSIQNHIFSELDIGRKETTSSTLNSIASEYENNKNVIETTSTVPYSSISAKLSKTIASGESLQHLNPDRKTQKVDIDSPDITTLSAFSSTMLSTKSPVPSPLTTRRSLRKSTQKLLATPFHQLTYVRNKAGDIDIDSIDNISIYPDLLDNDNNEPLAKPSTSRLTMISGYLPTSATATLPESIRIAKIKINRERKRMLRLRNVANYA